MANTTAFHNYRGAVALNNVGVTLIERRCYRQAIETLKDAIFVMRGVFNTATEKNSASGFASTSGTEARLQRATERLVNPHPVSSSSLINVISHDGTRIQPSMLSSLLKEGKAPSHSVTIRIESADVDSPYARDPDLESAVMLFNFGIAHLCSSKLSKSEVASKKLNQAALKLFNMAYAIISNKTSLSCMSDQDAERSCEVRLVIAAIVLKQVVEVLKDMGNHSEANQSMQRLIRLQSAISEMEQDINIVSDVSAAAA